MTPTNICQTNGHDFMQIGQKDPEPPRFICRKCGEVKTVESAGK